MNLSLCCISNVLAEQGYKFRTMTYKSFSSKPREESLEKLSSIISNNLSANTIRTNQYNDSTNIPRIQLFTDDINYYNTDLRKWDTK